MKTSSVGEYANNSKSVLADILGRWVPTGPRGGVITPTTEAGWRDSLYSILRESLLDVEIAKETGGWHSRGDIALRWKPWGASHIKHYIEVKSTLWTTGDLDHLISQVKRYFSDGGAQRVAVVICGEEDERVRSEFVQSVRREYRFRMGVNVFWKKGARRGVETLA